MDGLTVHLALAAVAFLAATVLPGSSEALFAALLIERPDAATSLFLAATVGNTTGACLNWILGRFLMRFAGRRWFPASPALIERVSKWFQQYGAWLLLFSWVPIIGDPLTVAAGFLRVRFAWFLALVAVGKGTRYLAVMAGATAVSAWFTAGQSPLDLPMMGSPTSPQQP